MRITPDSNILVRAAVRPLKRRSRSSGCTSAEMAAPQSKKSTKSETKSAPDKSGMTGAERRTKCSEEWKAAKAAGKTAGQKWPQFYSECNKRLKGGA